jgi:hypothetical protein
MVVSPNITPSAKMFITVPGDAIEAQVPEIDVVLEVIGKVLIVGAVDVPAIEK